MSGLIIVVSATVVAACSSAAMAAHGPSTSRVAATAKCRKESGTAQAAPQKRAAAALSRGMLRYCQWRSLGSANRRDPRLGGASPSMLSPPPCSLLTARGLPSSACRPVSGCPRVERQTTPATPAPLRTCRSYRTATTRIGGRSRRSLMRRPSSARTGPCRRSVTSHRRPQRWAPRPCTSPLPRHRRSPRVGGALPPPRPHPRPPPLPLPNLAVRALSRSPATGASRLARRQRARRAPSTLTARLAARPAACKALVHPGRSAPPS